MHMNEGHVYRCRNRDCGREIKVTKSSIESTSKPRCSCGAEMKRPYEKPVLRTLNPDVEILAKFESIRNDPFQPILS